MLRIQSPLSDDVEQLIHDTIGCCIRVHRELGPGLFERVYVGALCLELKAAGIQFEREKRYVVSYRGEAVSDQYLDLVVGNQVVLEVKAVEDVAPIYHQQILSYMRIARLRAGLLVNFNVAILPDGLSRKVL
ncbi:MAG TPA: GxxExxY protein [Vicinamibacterales bacterium]|jgi:GxxExxY protein|nr:GxxExxY protein [Vicinamibacterales bacterium]